MATFIIKIIIIDIFIEQKDETFKYYTGKTKHTISHVCE